MTMFTSSSVGVMVRIQSGRPSEGRITDRDIARAKAQIGIPTPLANPQWNPTPDQTSVSHFAFGYGDDNPLWHDPSYAKSTRWAGVIAPPIYATTTGLDAVPPFEPDSSKRALFRGLFRGVGKYYAGVNWEFYRPIRPGDSVMTEGRTTTDVVVRHSDFGAGRSVLESYRQLYVNPRGDPYAAQRDSFISIERGGSRNAGRYNDWTRPSYTPAEIAEIDESYASEKRRGATPRYWEDVTVGDDLGHVTKGPLTVLDIIGWHQGYGFGSYGIGPLRFAWKQRQRMPAFYVTDEHGVPDAVQSLHWDPARAAQVGLPAPYDYGEMGVSWLSHLVTNWMGDDAWLWRLEARIQAFNFIGDTTWIRGEVEAKEIVDSQHLVRLALRAENQRGEVTAPGTATVLLPTRRASPTLPEASETVRRRAAEMISESSGIGRNR